VNSFYGTCTSFDFGAQFRHGGTLVGLWSWTLDAGIGVDDYLVAISSSGDVVIYEGTDPTLPTTFAIRGVWFVGGVPAGRRIATDFGGDLLILSSVGVVPLSKLVTATDVSDTSQYATQKIGNLFNRSVATYGALKGWSLSIHPEDNTLLVTIPVADGQATNQLAMSLLTRGWAQYRKLPIVGSGAWKRKLYIGTADGRVCVNTDYLDNVNLAASSYSSISCSGITAFRNGGNATQKQVVMIRPTIISEGGSVANTFEARYRYDLTEASPPISFISNASNLWGSGLWGTALWGGGFVTEQPASGASGMGPDAAIAFRLEATSRTVLTGIDVVFTE